MITLIFATLLVSHNAVDPTGWQTAGMTTNRPAISFFENHQPRFVMTCKDTQTRIQIRDFVAAQQWPQPTLSVKFGTVEHAAKPDLAMIGDQTAFAIEFPISDSVLTALKNGATITATYRGETRSYPIPPSAYRTEFVEKCAALVPASMRNR
jgi:hypothetical protein